MLASFKIWSGKRDSNSRPRPWQGRALPTELFPRIARPLALLVPRAGIEPARSNEREILSLLCLPISPSGQRKWRLESESNRRTRSCSPLHDHSAIQPFSCHWHLRYRIWSGKRDSNSRPRPWQGRALPTELFPLCVVSGAYYRDTQFYVNTVTQKNFA
jgi:hypothetical protein